MDDTTGATPSSLDKFLAALTTLYRRFSVQIDLAGSALLAWYLALPQVCTATDPTCTTQAAFLSHLPLPAWMLPPLLFVVRSIFTAIPQPAMRADTDVKAMKMAAEKNDLR